MRNSAARFWLSLTAAMGAGAITMSTVQAAPAAISNGVRVAADSMNVVEKTQFVFGGRQYCWYANGWNGPGWYLCGYDWRRGFGYGGPMGWHNWHPGDPVHGPGSSHNPRPAPSPGSGGSPVVDCGHLARPNAACGNQHPPPPKTISGSPSHGIPPGSGSPNPSPGGKPRP